MKQSKPSTPTSAPAIEKWAPPGWRGDRLPFKVLKFNWTYSLLPVQQRDSISDLQTLYNRLETKAMCATSCPAKPWDTLRKYPESVKKPPIGTGTWSTSKGLKVHVPQIGGSGVSVDAMLNSYISATSAREVGEFLIECADQIEGK